MEKILGKRKKENIIVGVVSLGLIIILILSVGFNNIEYLISSPIVWNDPDYIDVTLIDKEESIGNMELTFIVKNSSKYDFDSYKLLLYFGNDVLELNDVFNPDIDSYSAIVIEDDFSKNGSLKRLYSKLNGKEIENIDFKVHIKELSADNEIIVENRGTFKIIVVLLISIISSILVFKEIVKPTWLRILCKFLMVPLILTGGIILLVVIIGGNGNGVPVGTASKNKAAAENYKREANLKAGALAHGNTREAAFSQARMDKNFVDMLPTNASTSLKNEYKRQAQLKAGALAHGNEKEAAKCQASMDRLMAEMLNK